MEKENLALVKAEDLKTFEVYYEILSNGDIFSKRINKKLKPELLNGYHRVKLCANGVSVRIFIHRLVALKYCVKESKKDYVNHKDGNKLNNDYTNLEWCTNKENILHASLNGLNSKKFCELDIKEIRIMHKKGITQRCIANKYNASTSTINHIINHKIWNHVRK